jgi:hypothetical protein
MVPTYPSPNALRFASALATRLRIAIRLSPNILSNRSMFPEKGTVQIAIRIRGGVGDALIAARWIYDITPIINKNGNVAVDVYYALPQNIEFIFAHFECVRFIYDDSAFACVHMHYDLALIINHLGSLGEVSRNDARVRDIPGLVALLESHARTADTYKQFTDKHYHPVANSGFTEFARAKRLKRYAVLYDQTGLQFRSLSLPLALAGLEQLVQYNLTNKYITVHDGWDSQLRLADGRPTKTYPLALWRSLVLKLKRRFNGISIVQLGGHQGGQIDGVDLSLKNRVDLATAARVLQGALLHIDTDSGLVHIAACIGTKSVVLFGPTDMEYFGYDTNYNISPGECGNCWMSARSWLPSCHLGDVVPRCMMSISPDVVVAAASRMILHN